MPHSFLRTQFVLPFFVLALFTGCKDDDPVPPTPSFLQLSTVDASCTEAWLRVKLDAAAQPRVVVLKRDTVTFFNQTIISTDTMIVDEGLLPHRVYQYQALRLSNGGVVEKTPSLPLTTMDTTSHNFTWEVDTLGDASSMLSDIAIVNDTLAYAVGEMYLRDSTGQVDQTAYNVAKWNGSHWQLLRIQFLDFCTGLTTYSYPARSVFAFGEHDIWISAGSQIARFNGAIQAAPICIPVSVTKLWGDNPNSLYAVGSNGSIAHFSGTNWQQLQTGMSLDVRDIWGASNQSGQMEILALASTYTAETQENRVLKIVGNSAAPVSAIGLAMDMASIWFVPGRKYYAVGAGIHRKRTLSDSAWIVYPHGVVTSFGSWGVRGTGVNNVFVAGSFGEMVHFNGVNWHRYFGGVSLPGGALGPMAVTDRLVMAVGHIGASRGIVLIGRR